MPNKIARFIEWALISGSMIIAVFIVSTHHGAASQTSLISRVTPTLGRALNEVWSGDNQTGDTRREQDSDDIWFERISVEQGLSHSTVNTIFQDSKGFMWFGTTGGLNRYDGYSFKVYKHDPGNPNSLSDNNVYSIIEDSNGMLWIGTYGGGLNRFDPKTEQFTHYQNDPDQPRSLSNNNIRSMFVDRSGTLWIATHGGGLNRFDREAERFSNYQPDPDDKYSLQDWLIDSIYEDREGVLWIGSNNEGLVKFDRLSGRFLNYQHNPDDPYSLSSNFLLTAILEDRKGMLWVATMDGLNRFDRENGQFVRYHHDPDDPHSLSHDTITTIYEDQSGALWVGTADGLNRFDRGTGTFIRYQNDPADPHSLSSNLVNSIFEDRAGALWIGTMAGGLNRVDRSGSRFPHYFNDPDNPNGLNNNIINAIYEDQSGVLWIGTWGGGLNRFDRANGQWRHFKNNPNDPDSLSHDITTSIFEDRSGTLWIGTMFGGLNQLDRTADRFKRYESRPDDPYSLSGVGIRCIIEDHEGILWIGTHGGGLNAFDQQGERFTHYTNDPDDPHSLSDNWIYAIYEDHKGALWVGTRGGGLNLFDRDKDQFTHYRYDRDDPHSLSSDFVQAIYQDSSGALWVGTEGGGLNKFDQDKNAFIHYGNENGLPDSSIFGILEDDQGRLWLSTGNGLSRFDPQTARFKNYDVRDGLQGNVFIAGASYKSPKGEMFFGGFNGFNAYFPELIEDNDYIPPVVLTSLTQGGIDLNLGTAPEYVSEVILQRPNNFFEFEFAALNYVQPEKNQYAYMLEGFDTDWNYTGARRFGRYGNLPDGTYRLRIKGSNNDGKWNEEGISLNFNIVPPFWATWWFRGIVALVLVVGIVGGYRLRVRNIEARSRELESQVRERTHQLEALYRAEERMHRHLRLDQVLQALVDVTVDILQANKSAVLLWDEGQEKWVMQVVRGFSPEAIAQLSFKRGEGITGQVAASGEPAVVEEVRTDLSQDHERPEAVQAVLSEGIQSFMHIPILVDGETFGIFNVSFTESHPFDQEEQRLFLALAQRASLAIENARLYEQAQELAALEERQRLARDLHDAVTQTLFSTSLIAEVLPRIWEQDPDEGRRRLDQVRQASRSALAEMRTLLLELRPSGLVEADLGELLRQLGEAITGRARISVSVDIQDAPEVCTLPTDVHVAIYRIAQEALNNAAKHAQASQAIVCLQREPEQITLSISDDGCGFDPNDVPPDHFGISIMHERAEAIGAHLEVESRKGQGTRVMVTWSMVEGQPAKGKGGKWATT